MALKGIFQALNDKTAFMAIFTSLSETSALRLRTAARMALEFLMEKKDLPGIKNYVGRWAKAPATAEMKGWVAANIGARKGGAVLRSYMTVAQSSEMAAAMADSLAVVSLSDDAKEE